ncbi:Uncharacterised protein [Mycobacterium tuberculosis]|uniref:Uncharacterized protein n=1 Tax=Mycobacterium tuberculosis TaxID=1773 RepID=A0A655FQ40_MYCTX|nr:Uncharacterised protein [Mycobacterium tuberculosis]CNV98333.1 Uncharacterised protein [Mycobacterium tuberculosis]COW87150.1 Uncharacterised protein [Mycobacterium tuberculosis]
MFLHRELAVTQGVVENPAGVLPVAVFGAGCRRYSARKGCAQPLRHRDDSRSLAGNLNSIPPYPRNNGAGCVSVVWMASYSGQRATAATGSGLHATATLPAGRGVFGTHRCVGGVRRQPLPAARRKVSWEAQPGHLPDLPQGAAHTGVVGVRRAPRCGIRVRAHRRRTDPAGDPVLRVRGPRGGGMSNLQLESSGQVIRPGRRTSGTPP